MLQLEMPRDYVNQPLLKRVATPAINNVNLWEIGHAAPHVQWSFHFVQVREMADEEMLQDAEIHFE
jgi:hypothetical protein